MGAPEVRAGLSVWAMLAASLLAGHALADAPAQPAAMQPPMNNFDFAFYTCQAGAFEIDYDSETPAHATLVTGDRSRKHELDRAPSPSGVQFAGKGVKFWTDGKRVLVEGTATPLQNCHLKIK